MGLWVFTEISFRLFPEKILEFPLSSFILIKCVIVLCGVSYTNFG